MDHDKRITPVLGILFLLILGGIYFVFRAQKEKAEEVAFDYNGFLLRRVQNGYKVQIFINQNKNPSFFTIRNDPRGLENIPIDPKVLELKAKKQVYAVIDPYVNLTGVTTVAVLEMENVIENPFLYHIPFNSAFIREYPGKKMGVRTCRDVNATVGVIWLRVGGDNTAIYYEDGCIIMESPTEIDLIKAADRLVLTLLAVMKA